MVYGRNIELVFSSTNTHHWGDLLEKPGPNAPWWYLFNWVIYGLPGLVNLQKTMENHIFLWVNQRFRLGHVPCRFLYVYQMVNVGQLLSAP